MKPFLEGRSASVQVDQNRELKYKNRGTFNDLTDLSKKKKGFDSW